MVLSLSGILAFGSLVGCQKSNSDSQDSGSSGSKQEKTYMLSTVNQNANYAKYLSNITIDSSRDDGFKVRTNPYRVGDDNPYKFKPILVVVDDDLNPASEANWDKPFDIKVEIKNADAFEVADAALYEILDAKECVIQFKEGAAGHTFKLSVVPTGIPEASINNFTKTLTIDVIDGYNVYDAKELGLLDTRTTKVSESEEMPLDSWSKFKTANGIDATLKPNNLVLQHDVNITLNDLPPEVVYSANDHGANFAGTMRDWVGVYTLEESNKDITLFGNYFQFNFSQLPLITYYEGDATHVNSHSMLFDVRRGTFTVEDINVTGNAKYATEENEDKYAGGLMFIKARRYVEAINARNILGRESFITFMGEDTETEKGYVDFDINNCKFSNNYNSFLYNWGGKMVATNTDFVKCGGPIIIQDHVGVGDDNVCEREDYSIIGIAPETIFNNCKLENYVAGTEAWFNQFNVTAMVGQIKGLSDAYSAQLGLTYLVDSQSHAPTTTAGSNATLFNFVAINKSGKAEGATNLPVCGKVIINDGEDADCFNYSQPTQEDVQAYVDLNTFMAEQEAAVKAYGEGDGGAALAALFTKWEFQPADMTQEAIQAAITEKAMELQQAAAPTINHAALRGVNATQVGGQYLPVFQSGGQFACFGMDGEGKQYMQDLSNVVTGATDPLAPTNPFKANATNYTGIYYMGMMLVFGLKELPKN